MNGKIFGRLPIFATAVFSMEKPDNWDDLSKDEKDNYFLETTTLKVRCGLCHQCARSIETDFTVDIEAVEGDTLDLWEDDK